eukprot:6202451-Pleurochrysis_carterae.AAC.1
MVVRKPSDFHAERSIVREATELRLPAPCALRFVLFHLFAVSNYLATAWSIVLSRHGGPPALRFACFLVYRASKARMQSKRSAWGSPCGSVMT